MFLPETMNLFERKIEREAVPLGVFVTSNNCVSKSLLSTSDFVDTVKEDRIKTLY